MQNDELITLRVRFTRFDRKTGRRISRHFAGDLAKVTVKKSYSDLERQDRCYQMLGAAVPYGQIVRAAYASAGDPNKPFFVESAPVARIVEMRDRKD